VSSDHDDHDDHDHGHGSEDHGPPEDPRWVLLPLLVGLVIGIAVLVLLGLDSGVAATS
jgi:hypothetical protein